METTAATKLQTIEARLTEQGARMGTIDAYGAEIRHLECQGLARTLRAVAADSTYSLGDIDPAIIERIAHEIEKFH